MWSVKKKSKIINAVMKWSVSIHNSRGFDPPADETSRKICLYSFSWLPFRLYRLVVSYSIDTVTM